MNVRQWNWREICREVSWYASVIVVVMVGAYVLWAAVTKVVPAVEKADKIFTAWLEAQDAQADEPSEDEAESDDPEGPADREPASIESESSEYAALVRLVELTSEAAQDQRVHEMELSQLLLQQEAQLAREDDRRQDGQMTRLALLEAVQRNIQYAYGVDAEASANPYLKQFQQRLEELRNRALTPAEDDSSADTSDDEPIDVPVTPET